jgi:hypothetical protein
LDKTRTIVGPAGSYAISCSGALAKNYVISYMKGTLTVTLAHVRLTYAAARSVTKGKKAVLSAYLFVTPSSPVVGRKMVFTLGTNGTVQHCTTGVTNSHGFGTCTLKQVKQPKGYALVTYSFAGDPVGPHYDYAKATASTVIVVKK